MRHSQGLTQERFAHRYGLDRSWLGHVENSNRNLTIETIEKLAHKLDVEVFVLVQRPPEEAPPPTELPREEAG